MSSLRGHHRAPHRGYAAALAVGVVLAGAPATFAVADDDNGHDGELQVVAKGFSGPRGLAVDDGDFLVAELDGTISRVRPDDDNGNGDADVKQVGKVPGAFIAPGVDIGPNGRRYVVTSGHAPEVEIGPTSAKLFYLKQGKRVMVADFLAYQKKDPDPYDLQDFPTESNPFGIAVLDDRSVLVADAAGNELVRVWPDGDMETVARLKPRMVKVPGFLPEAPPVDTMKAEAVATSVTVGDDGYWYVGELRGFPATPNTSQVWRIKPDSEDAVCDPKRPHRGDCQRFADGFTSIVDLAADDDGNIYVLELSKKSWLAWELGIEGAAIGALHRLSDDGEESEELVPGKLRLPGSVDVDDDDIYVSNPVFGPGRVSQVDD